MNVMDYLYEKHLQTDDEYPNLNEPDDPIYDFDTEPLGWRPQESWEKDEKIMKEK